MLQQGRGRRIREQLESSGISVQRITWLEPRVTCPHPLYQEKFRVSNRLAVLAALLSVFAYLSGLGALGVFSGSAHALVRRGNGLSGNLARRQW